jgi:hypothetical protein
MAYTVTACTEVPSGWLAQPQSLMQNLPAVNDEMVVIAQDGSANAYWGTVVHVRRLIRLGISSGSTQYEWFYVYLAQDPNNHKTLPAMPNLT